jgi:anti-anti-sigma factor
MTAMDTDSAGGFGAPALQAVQRARPGDHLCCFHGEEHEQRRLATAFVSGALGAGDRVLYVANERSPDDVASVFGRDGLGAAIRSGQLSVMDFTTVYGTPEEIDVASVLGRYQDEAEVARARGYPGLRVAVEMGDFVAALGSVEAVVRWERTVTPALADAGIAGMCQYDRRILDREAHSGIVAAHPAVATDDGTVPIATFTATTAPPGLAVAGEIDVSTAPAFARALRARAAVTSRVQVDLGDVRFVDVAGLRAIFDVAREAAPGAVVVLDRPSPGVRRVLRLLGWSDPRVEIVEP